MARRGPGRIVNGLPLIQQQTVAEGDDMVRRRTPVGLNIPALTVRVAPFPALGGPCKVRGRGAASWAF